MWWDTLLAIVIVVGLLIIVAARASHQTIAELFGSIWDMIRDKKEDIQDGEIAYYANR
jgi:hypothetical protein